MDFLTRPTALTLMQRGDDGWIGRVEFGFTHVPDAAILTWVGELDGVAFVEAQSSDRMTVTCVEVLGEDQAREMMTNLIRAVAGYTKTEFVVAGVLQAGLR